MLISLSIKNYALIENLKVDFRNKLSIITGETGAGKSILLGGLSLVLGKRANVSLVNNKDKKCVIEVEFAIDNYNLKSFFEEEDLDYEPITTLRREILPNGKSRAFVNDTPTTLSILSALSEQLIDIHSQHETLQLADSEFQFRIIDALAENQEHLASYKRGLVMFRKMTKELDVVLVNQQKLKEKFDYNSHLLNELAVAKLLENEQLELEDTLEKLTHTEDIKLNLAEALQIAEDEEIGARNLVRKIKNNLDKIAKFDASYQTLSDRMQSLFIELSDIIEELESENDRMDYSPEELQKINDRLQLIYNLQKKHAVNSVIELLSIQKTLELEVYEMENADEIIAAKTSEIKKIREKLEELTAKIHQRREKAIPLFMRQLETILVKLEMKNTRFLINLMETNQFLNNGKDTLEFLISSNKGANFESLKNAASGGEMSRIMLAVKAILSKYTKLPAIIFDEIDTGVSGEVSNKIADVMQEMSENMQVITITHLPQIAAKGNQHYKVFKEENNNAIHSNIRLLSKNERIEEIAEMLSGKNISESALAHAKQLLT